MTVMESVAVAAGLTVVLAALHVLAPRLRTLPFVPEAVTGSFAGGLAVAYVFLHLLPELVEGNEALGEALGDTVEHTPLLELSIFLVALAGFTVFYGLERLADRHHPRSAGDGRGSGAVYGVHVGAFLLYNGLITYTLALRVRTGLVFALLFVVAIGLHFVLTDRGLHEHYGERFTRSGRFLLVGGLVAGWLAGAVAAPTSALVVALLTALLAGSVLLNVFKEELPDPRRSSFPWFLVGLALYAVLLLAVTAAHD
ncbi:MAG TPA: hypothetical protein VNU26_05155 [Mycobacteriales bacterium]|nr:hypothetical protein [Mycobacteriales bacterium]